MTGPVSLYWTILYYILYEYVVLYGPAVRPCGIPGCPFYYPLHCINTTNPRDTITVSVTMDSIVYIVQIVINNTINSIHQ
jgi:hypothetical protein